MAAYEATCRPWRSSPHFPTASCRHLSVSIVLTISKKGLVGQGNRSVIATPRELLFVQTPVCYTGSADRIGSGSGRRCRNITAGIPCQARKLGESLETPERRTGHD